MAMPAKQQFHSTEGMEISAKLEGCIDAKRQFKTAKRSQAP